ncbi:MAG: GIY-YIG nuclease family protein [Chthoniobacter sp.]|nr:GIY-YIG nuclease family protein [Chthoniobacter sp.]
MSDQVTWLGHSFYVCHIDSNWSQHGGVYIFTALDNKGQWWPFYIGQSEQFSNRLPNHERWEEAVRMGATHVHAMVVPQAATRDAIERELIRRYQPKLNTHHVG